MTHQSYFFLKKIVDLVSLSNRYNQFIFKEIQQVQNQTLFLTDGSIWKPIPNDISFIEMWKPKNRILISYSGEGEIHQLNNLSLQNPIFSSVRAALVMHPMAGPDSLFIQNINYVHHLLELNTGLKFRIEPNERFDHWLTDEMIIMGTRYGPQDSRFNEDDWMLINLQQGSCVLAMLV